MFVLLGYDEDWYTFETFMGVFSTKKKAQEYADNDYEMCGKEKFFNHEKYVIKKIKLDTGV